MVGGLSNNIFYDKIRRTILLNCFEPPTACDLSGVFNITKDETMKKFFMTSSCLALALTSFSANAVDIKPFIGGNISLNGVAYSDDTKTATEDIGIDLPEAFVGIGFEAGVKFATDNLYSAAVTFAYDYAFNNDADIESFAEDYISSAEVGFSAWSFTFDNYLRVSGNSAHRQDIVLGIGAGSANERAEINFTPYAKSLYGLEDEKGDDDGTVVVFKVGYNYNISEHADWYVNGRFFVPTDSETDVDVLFNASAGLRFLF